MMLNRLVCAACGEEHNLPADAPESFRHAPRKCARCGGVLVPQSDVLASCPEPPQSKGTTDSAGLGDCVKISVQRAKG